jgi:hypothetical protein
MCLMLGASGVLVGRSTVSDAQAPGRDTSALIRLSPWIGAGVGVGSVSVSTSGNLSAGPSFAGRLDAGLEIASRFRLALEDYAQLGFLLEDSQNSAAMRSVTLGARLWTRLVVKGGLGVGTYTFNYLPLANNPTMREVGVEILHGPRILDSGFHLQYYASQLGPSSAKPNRYRLHGIVVGAAVQVHLLDAIVDYNRP